MAREKEHTIRRIKRRGHYYLQERDKTGKVTAEAPWYKNPIKRSKAINYVENKRANDYFESRKQITKKDVYKELLEKTKSIEKQQKLTELEPEITKGKEIHLGRQQLKTGKKLDRQKATTLYKKVLKQIGVAEEKIPKIIQRRDKLLKKRFVVTITLTRADKLPIGQISIGGILPEKELEINDYWMDRTVNSDEFYVYAREFKRIIGNPRIYKPTALYNGTGTVKHIETDWSFA